jgi:hypothetical protein
MLYRGFVIGAVLLLVVTGGAVATAALVGTASPSIGAASPSASTFGAQQLAAASASLSAAPSHGWSQLPNATGPPKVAAEVLVYDASDHYVLLFGGRDKWTPFNGPFLGETWSFANGTWTQLHPTSSPSARGHSVAVYDAADGYVVLFGGLQQGGGPVGGGSMYDTWTFHAGVWTKLPLTVHPSARYQAAMAYDTAMQRVVLFGGTTGANETWQFHAGKWTELHPAVSPPGRRLAMMAYDPAAGAIILFGGCQGGGCAPMLGDTWSFAGGTWTQLHPATSPSPRIGSGFSYDPALGEIVLFGGENATALLGDTWTFHNLTWANPCVHCGPNPRWLAVTTYVPGSPGTLVMYGGDTKNGFNDQTWEYS